MPQPPSGSSANSGAASQGSQTELSSASRCSRALQQRPASAAPAGCGDRLPPTRQPVRTVARVQPRSACSAGGGRRWLRSETARPGDFFARNRMHPFRNDPPISTMPSGCTSAGNLGGKALGEIPKRFTPRQVEIGQRQWPRRGSNPHGDSSPRDFKSRASASFATRPPQAGRS